MTDAAIDIGLRFPRRPPGASARILRVAPLVLLVLLVLLGSGALLGALSPAAAIPGNALLVLERAPAAGDFDASAYLRDPGGFPALAQSHPDGWAIVWRAADPPPGWTRPLALRGGGRASNGALLDPRYLPGLARALPASEAAIVALLDAPDAAACYPGKPNPHPFTRGAWSFLHDGEIDIAPATTGIWRAEWCPAWEAFKADHPRDYDGNGDSTRGNAGEIYFLTLLYEIAQGPGGVADAFGRVLLEFSALPGAEAWSMNAILQGPPGTWALRYAPAEADRYRVFYTRTLGGDYCIVDSLPGSGSGWEEIPHSTLAFFPRGGEVELTPVVLPSAIDGGEGDSAARSLEAGPTLAPAAGPCVGSLRLRYTLPPGARGTLDIHAPDGRRLARLDAEPPSGTIAWAPTARVRSGILYARLRAGGFETTARLLFLR